MSREGRDRPLGADWRAEGERIQEAALPRGRVVVSGPAPLGVGGVGRHLREIVDALDRAGQPNVCLCEDAGPPSSRSSRRPTRGRDLARALGPLVRFSPAWRMWAASVGFDADAARRLPPADHLIAFNGTADAQFRAARRARWSSISLVTANAHFRRVIHQYERAYRQYPIERPWATHLLKRNLSEYAQADRIYVSSSYVRESFVEEGFPDSVLSFFPLTPHPRYQPPASEQSSGTFDVVYIGSLTVDKGVPLLVDAIRRLPHPDLRLVLIGGWGTRGMRRALEQARSEDLRIEVSPGDPLERLQRARLYVHPAYQDGFGYAPAEALACGVPVIVSEDTGMKELIDPGVNGLIVPTGDLSALTDSIEAAYRGEVLRG